MKSIIPISLLVVQVVGWVMADMSISSREKSGEMVAVVVAKTDLPVGTVLEEKDLENALTYVNISKAGPPPYAVFDVEDLKGKQLNRTLRRGSFFSVDDVSAVPVVKLPDGLYKYAIKVNKPYNLTPGDRVDMTLNESLPDGKNRSGVFLRNILVLALDISHSAPAGVWRVDGVTLAVTPQQGLTLSAAEKRGEIKLLLCDPKNAK